MSSHVTTRTTGRRATRLQSFQTLFTEDGSKHIILANLCATEGPSHIEKHHYLCDMFETCSFPPKPKSALLISNTLRLQLNEL